MQPDSIRPASSMPKLTFSDDISHFQSKVLHLRANIAPENATIQLRHYRRNWPHFQNLDAYPASRHAGCVFFAANPAVFGCFLVRLAKVAQFYRHGIAAMAPQMRSGG